ncbi:MAG TPA: TonB-dependent receptor, partial [Planctomycetota bacterium]|nr:TonB-dependent receptor [Planctomycetota bacterium]
MNRAARLAALAVLAAAVAAPALAQDAPAARTVSAEPAPTRFEDLTVTAHPPYTTAGSEEIRSRDFELRPKNRTADVLRLVPGLVIAQHQGGGKAEQIFLRGFDCDHGTDVAIFLDDVPFNLRSHAHGQGYADEHWLIPEVVERIEVVKGPYDPSLGDFATAGSLRMYTRRNFTESEVSASGGMWSTRRYVAAVGQKVGSADVLGAFEYYFTDGPFDTPEDYDRFNGFGKVTLPVGDTADLSLWFSGYSADWTGSGEVPLRAIDQGLIGRFGAIDPTEGGHTQRYNIDASFKADLSSRDEVKAGAYYTRYQMQLFNDFTFFLNDPVNGDEIEQDDRRQIVGANVQGTHVFRVADRDLKATAGLDTRSDFVHVRLGTAVKRARLATTQEVEIAESSYGAFVRLEAPLAERVRAIGGLRGDYYHASVQDEGSAPGLEADGRFDGAIPGGTVSLVFGPYDKAEIYLNFGAGHHSNDARALVRSSGDFPSLAQLLAYEIGARTKAFDDRLDVGASAFLYDLSSELVQVGDEGTTEASDRTQRTGLELEARLRLLDWLYLGGDISYTDARFVRTGEAVPLAPRLLARADLTARAPFGLSGSLEMRYVGP